MEDYCTFSVELSEIESEGKCLDEYMAELEKIFKRACRPMWFHKIAYLCEHRKWFRFSYTALCSQLSDFEKTIETPIDRKLVRNLCEFRSTVVSREQERSKDRATFFCTAAAFFSGLLALDYFEKIIAKPCLIIVAILLLVGLSLVIYWEIDCNKEAFYKLVADFLQDDGEDESTKNVEEIQSKPSKKYQVHVRS